MNDVDSVIHQPVRLRIMAALMSLSNEERIDFSYLKSLLSVTDGNLGAHLLKLEDAGYIAVDKIFVSRKPRTFVTVTDKGKAAFRAHVAALQAIVDSSKPPDSK